MQVGEEVPVPETDSPPSASVEEASAPAPESETAEDAPPVPESEAAEKAPPASEPEPSAQAGSSIEPAPINIPAEIAVAPPVEPAEAPSEPGRGSTEAIDSLADSDSPADDAQEPPPAEPLSEDVPSEEVAAEAVDVVDGASTEASPADAAETEAGTADEEEHIAPAAIQEHAEDPIAEAAVDEVPPPAPEPPGHSDDVVSVEDGAEKKVQFAPGTPEPKPTQRKKKNGKSSKGKKGKKSLPSSDDQESPDDIVAIVKGPFDEPGPVPQESADAAVPDAGGEDEIGTGGKVSSEEPHEQAEVVEPSAAPAPDDIVNIPVKAESAKVEKSSKKKGKDKGKKKSSKSKAKVVEASPVITGLGIDLSGDANHDEPAIVTVAEPDVAAEDEKPTLVEEPIEAPEPPAEDPQVTVEHVQDSQDVPAAAEATNSEPIKVEPAAESDPQPNAETEQTSQTEDEASVDSAEPVGQAVEESHEHDLQENAGQAETPAEAASPSQSEANIDMEDPVDGGDQLDGKGVGEKEGEQPLAVVEELRLKTSVAGPEEMPNNDSDQEGSPEDSPELPDGQESSGTPDSAVDLGESSTCEEKVRSQITGPTDEGHATVPTDVDEGVEIADVGSPEGPAEVVPSSEQLDEVAKLEEVVEEAQSESPAVSVAEAFDDPLPGSDGSETEEISSKGSELVSESEIIEGPAEQELESPAEANETVVAKETVMDLVYDEHPPSIEQLSNATEVGEDSTSEGEEDSLSPPHDTGLVDEATNSAAGADNVKDEKFIVVDGASDGGKPSDPGPEEVVEAAAEMVEAAARETVIDSSETVEDAAAVPSQATEEVNEPPSTILAEQKDDAVVEEPSDAAEPAAVVVPLEDSPPEDSAPTQDESKESLPPSDDSGPGVVQTETEPDGPDPDAIKADTAPGDTTIEATPTGVDENENNAAPDDQAVEPLANSESTTDTAVDKAAPIDHGPVADASSQLTEDQVGDGGLPVTEEPVIEGHHAAEVAEPAKEPGQDPEPTCVVPEVAEAAEIASPELEELATPQAEDPAPLPVIKETTSLPAEDPAPLPVIEEPASLPAEADAPPSPNDIVEQQPATLDERAEAILPVLAAVPNAMPSEPPSPKLSRSSGSKSKGERYQIRPTKKHSKDSDKHKRSSKDRRERTPEEEAERQRKKDARRRAEASRLLEEERRRFEEEEMRRIRHEARRAARKAAAEEVARLAREEAEAIAKRDAERRRRRRENDLRPRERRESEARPRERRESKSSGGFFGMGAGQSETKAGLFLRTDSGASSRSQDSKDRYRRRASQPRERAGDNTHLKDDHYKSTSNEGSSGRQRRHRTEGDRVEPRRRDTGEKRERDRKEGDRKHASKPEKPKGFFGSLFSKF